MDVLTVAAKANAVTVLPVIIAATCVIKTSPQSKLAISYEDAESVGSGAKFELKTKDGKVIRDADVLPYLRETYPTLQSGNKEQVCVLYELAMYCWWLTVSWNRLMSGLRDPRIFSLSISKYLTSP